MTSATKFVVLEMPVEKSILKLISFLESDDFTDIVCARSLANHKSVEKYIEDQLSTRKCVHCKSPQMTITSRIPENPSRLVANSDQTNLISSTSHAESETAEVKVEPIYEKSDMVESKNSEQRQEFQLKTVHPTITEQSNRTNEDTANNADNKDTIKTEPGIANKTSTIIILPIGKNKLKEHGDKHIAEKVDVTTNSAPFAENFNEHHSLETLLTDDQNSFEESPPVIWLKRKRNKQSVGEAILANDLKTEGNRSPLVKNEKHDGDQTSVEACPTEMQVSVGDANTQLACTSIVPTKRQPGRPKSINVFSEAEIEKSSKDNGPSSRSKHAKYNSENKPGEGIVKCKVCFKIARRHKGKSVLESLLIHAKNHADVKQYHCTVEECYHSNVLSHNITTHMKNKHNKIGTAKSIVNDLLKISWVESFERCYPTNEIELVALKHTRPMRGLLRGIPSPMEKMETGMVRSNTNENKKADAKVKCKVCFADVKQLNGRSILDRLLVHAKFHADVKQYHCAAEGCNYSSVRSRGIIDHMKSQHSIIGTAKIIINDDLRTSWLHSFEECYPTLNSELACLKRKFGPANMEKLEKCMVCSKDVSRSQGKNVFSSLLRHSAIHADIKQYHCTVVGCDYSNVRSTKANLHMKTKHNVIGKAKSIVSDELKKSLMTSFQRCYPTRIAEFAAWKETASDIAISFLQDLKLYLFQRPMRGVAQDLHASN